MENGKEQIRLALVGPSGVGKSTTAGILKAKLSGRQLKCSVQKLAKPLYDLKQMYYEVAGNSVDYNAQDHPLMEQIAKSLREISPTCLVDNLVVRLDESADDVIINDDLRDDRVDWPALAAKGFKFIRVYADQEHLKNRQEDRGDLRFVGESPLNAQLKRIRTDYVVTNCGSVDDLEVQLDGLIEKVLNTEYPQQSRLIG